MGVTTRRVRLSSKGQLVIPSDMRESMRIGAGDELVLHLISDRVLVAEVVEPSPLQAAMAKLRASADGRSITPDQVEAALGEVRAERRGNTADAQAIPGHQRDRERASVPRPRG